MPAHLLMTLVLVAPVLAADGARPAPTAPVTAADGAARNSAPPATSLDAISRALAAAPAWRAGFVQRYLPSGFDEGTSDEGTVVIEAPAKLRFDYAAPDVRTFAVDGSVARHLDPAGGTCDAVRLDSGVWSRLPLAAILDPGATRDSFAVASEGDTLRLVPRAVTAELAAILLTAGQDGLPTRIVVIDGAGNRNEFAFSQWTRGPRSPATFFAPSLPGVRPCAPEQP